MKDTTRSIRVADFQALMNLVSELEDNADIDESGRHMVYSIPSATYEEAFEVFNRLKGTLHI